MRAWWLALILALALPAPLAAQSIADAMPADPAHVMAVPPELAARLRHDVMGGHPGHSQRLQRLVAFMFGPAGLAMRYEEGASHSVAESYATRRGNCLAYTFLFVALARAAGLDAYPQEIDDVLSWDQRDGTIYRNNHVNAGVRIGARTWTVDVGGDAMLARHAPKRIDDRRLIALYFNNRAVELQSQQQTSLALQYIDTALTLDPGYPNHWSNSGVFHLRQGDAGAAEHAYRRALALDRTHSSALFNLAGLLQRNGDEHGAAALRRRLARVQRRDPFHQFLQALAYERAGDTPNAIVHFRRATQLHRGDHRLYAKLAGAYRRQGDAVRAAAALADAIDLSDGATRDDYRTQLQQLH